LKPYPTFSLLVVCSFLSAISFSLIVSTSASSQTTKPAANSFSIQPISTSTATKSSCPKDLATLTNLLIQDIPDYSNRVIQITQDEHQDAGIDSYIVTAGQPEIEPLNLPYIKYHETADKTPQQIFFTTLERQYTNNRRIEREAYHWLFVTLTDSGWYPVTMFSRFGSATQNTPPTPPQESSNGIIGQAVSIWLRDCRANTIK
jgi:hypothetical protein